MGIFHLTGNGSNAQKLIVYQICTPLVSSRLDIDKKDVCITGKCKKGTMHPLSGQEENDNVCKLRICIMGPGKKNKKRKNWDICTI
jgi:hypothetical protein